MPPFFGLKVFSDVDLNTIIPLINWRMYFAAWDLRSAQYTEAHKNLEADTRILLKEIVKKKMLKAAAVVGFFDVQRMGDDVCVGNTSLHFLRQQQPPYLSVADFFNPNEKDFIGLFAATAGLGAKEAEQKFKDQNDDYSAIMLGLIADRLAEAFTEKLHKDLLNGIGIRAAPGYPASPDHTEKATIWKLLSPEQNVGISLTENYAMNPVASECGYFAAHPQSCYFKVGPIGEDQFADYAMRKGMPVDTIRHYIF